MLWLLVTWEHGQIRLHDPETGDYTPILGQEREARLQAENRVATAEAEHANWKKNLNSETCSVKGACELSVARTLPYTLVPNTG